MTNGLVVTFGIGDTLLALPLGLLEEIVPLQPLSPFPDAPAHLLGTIRHRGKEVVLVDLGLLLGQKPRPPTPFTRVLVLGLPGKGAGSRVALRVDCVMGVDRPSAEQVSLLPEELRQVWA